MASSDDEAAETSITVSQYPDPPNGQSTDTQTPKNKVLPRLDLMRSVFGDNEGADGSASRSLSQLRDTQDDDEPIDPALKSQPQDQDEDEGPETIPDSGEKRRQSAGNRIDPKTQTKLTYRDQAILSIAKLAEVLGKDSTGEWLSKAMEIFNKDWVDEVSDEVAEKAQQRWENNDASARRFCLIKRSKRLA